jgi:hypothetical protein
LFSYPGEFPSQRWTEVDVSLEAEEKWSEVITRLYGTPMDTGEAGSNGSSPGGQRPHLVFLKPEAKTVFIRWFNAHADEMEDREHDGQAGAWSKMRAHIVRFALILSLLRWACDPPPIVRTWPRGAELPTDIIVTPPPLGPVEAIDVQGAIRLAEYFKSHLLCVAHRMTGGIDNVDARQIVNWIRRKRLTEFCEADVAADLRRFRKAPEALARALKYLLEVKAIRQKKDHRDLHRPGRKATPAYEVHPELLAAPENPENTANVPSCSTEPPDSGISGKSRRDEDNHHTEDREAFEL